jgi:GntP family gluconate:H+ symporter
MHPLWLLLIGVVIVVGGVLLLRLHAFLALTLAALVVGILTPPAAIERSKAAASRTAVRFDAGAHVAMFKRQDVPAGGLLLVLRADPQTGSLRKIGELRVERGSAGRGEEGETRARFYGPDAGGLQDRDVVIDPSAWQQAKRSAGQTVGERVAAAFGATCGEIGILIAMAAIIGKCLLDSGAADRIVRGALKVTGQPGAPLAFVVSGFLLGIPVFFDTVFYLMIPLGKALRLRTGRNYLLYVLSIVAGATMAHSLVPPTPGPLFVAEALQVDLGLMIVAGCGVGLVSSVTGYLFARQVNRRNELPLRQSPDFSHVELQKLAGRDDSQLPPLWLALTPIVLPIVLITGHTLLKTSSLGLPDQASWAAATLGNKSVALVVAAVIAILMLAWQKRSTLRDLAASVQAALASGGVIILITAAGGAFGAMLQQTGIANLIEQLPTVSPLLLIVLAFLITAAVRTAQGSATVAMITAVGILGGLAETGGFGCHPVFVALAIGCGSKPFAWMNDSGFWVICKMSGMTEGEGLKYVTPMTALMGLAGLLTTLAAAAVLPL